MRHIIIGGNGFVGRETVARIIEEGKDEVVVVDLPQSLADNPPADHPGVTLHPADVSKPGSLDPITLNADDVVHHMATQLITPNKPRFGRDAFFRKCAVDGTAEILAWMKRNGNVNLVFWSTDMVYGPVLEQPRTETHPMLPFGPYGRSKVAAEELIATAVAARDVNATIFRPRLILGSGRLGIFELLFKAVDTGRPIPLIGSGRNCFQFVAVHDCAAASLLAAEQGCPNGIYNLGSDDSPSSYDLLARFLKEAGSSSRLIRTPGWLVKGVLRTLNLVKVAPMDPEQYEIADLEVSLDTTAVKRDLHWQPTSTDNELLLAAYQAYSARDRRG